MSRVEDFWPLMSSPVTSTSLLVSSTNPWVNAPQVTVTTPTCHRSSPPPVVEPVETGSTSLAGTSASPSASTIRCAGPWPGCTTTTR